MAGYICVKLHPPRPRFAYPTRMTDMDALDRAPATALVELLTLPKLRAWLAGGPGSAR